MPDVEVPPFQNPTLQADHQCPAALLTTVITCFWDAADEQTRGQAAPKPDLPGVPTWTIRDPWQKSAAIDSPAI